jgi:hypothetical protein
MPSLQRVELGKNLFRSSTTSAYFAFYVAQRERVSRLAAVDNSRPLGDERKLGIL